MGRRYQQEGVRLALSARADGIFSYKVKVSNPPIAITGSVPEQSEGPCLHIVDDVAELPLASGPYKRKVPGPGFWVNVYLPGQAVEWNIDGRRQASGCGFTQYPDASMVVLIGSSRSPGVVNTVDYDPGLSLGGDLPCHGAAHEVDAGLDPRGHVGFPGIQIRRQKEPGARLALLVDIVNDLRVPDVVSLVYGHLGLDLSKGIPIAVVVVTGVVVIELRGAGSFAGGSQGLVVPLFHDVNAIRVERRHQQDNAVVKDLASFRRAIRRQPVCNIHRDQVAADLGRMNPAGDQNYCAAFGDEFIGFFVVAVDGARVGELTLYFLESVEPGQILG